MEELQELLTEFVSRTLKIDKAAVTSALFETEGDTLKVKSDALTFLTGKDAARITAITDVSNKKFQDGYQKAKKEERSVFEQEIKDQYGIQSDAIGLDLINHIVAEKSKAGEITDDIILKHPSFIKKERELIKAKEDAVAEILTKQKMERNSEIFTSKALDELEKLNPVLAQDANIAKNQKELFKMVLANENYDVAEDGTIILLNPDKSRRNDQHGHPIEFKDHVKSLASKYYQFQAADQRQAGGDPNKKGADGGGQGLKKPATKAEYLQEMNKLQSDRTMDAKERIAKQNELMELSKDLI